MLVAVCFGHFDWGLICFVEFNMSVKASAIPNWLKLGFCGNLDYLFLSNSGIGLVILASTFYLAASNPLQELHAFDVIAVLLLIIALCGETIADRQLEKFRATMTGGKSGVCNTGLWRYTRHPNYFCEWLFWCGLALLEWPFTSAVILYNVYFLEYFPSIMRKAIRYELSSAYINTTEINAFFPAPCKRDNTQLKQKQYYSWRVYLEESPTPNRIIRWGIRKQLDARIDGYYGQQHEYFDSFVSGLRRPIAIKPQAANEQHYEVPTSFFKWSSGDKSIVAVAGIRHEIYYKAEINALISLQEASWKMEWIFWNWAVAGFTFFGWKEFPNAKLLLFRTRMVNASIFKQAGPIVSITLKLVQQILMTSVLKKDLIGYFIGNVRAFAELWKTVCEVSQFP